MIPTHFYESLGAQVVRPSVFVEKEACLDTDPLVILKPG